MQAYGKRFLHLGCGDGLAEVRFHAGVESVGQCFPASPGGGGVVETMALGTECRNVVLHYVASINVFKKRSTAIRSSNNAFAIAAVRPGAWGGAFARLSGTASMRSERKLSRQKILLGAQFFRSSAPILGSP